METNKLTIYALGTSFEWYLLKTFSKIQNWKLIYRLMFEKEWKDYQEKLLGYYDSNLNIISYFNDTLILDIDFFQENYALESSSIDFTVKKFYKRLESHKKYIEWTINIEGELSKIVIELDFSICPRTCENFWQISTSHPVLSYENSLFYRVNSDLFIEGGLIQSKLKSIYVDYFPDENYNMLHDCSGIVGMSKMVPNCNGTSFYITLKPISYLNGKNVAFGKVVTGMDTVIKISRTRTINQRIIENINIATTGDYFQSSQKDEIRTKPEKLGYRDICNEILKYI
jgi:cyclophilin family peptidyl-prolyl cis-trans isomerase